MYHGNWSRILYRIRSQKSTIAQLEKQIVYVFPFFSYMCVNVTLLYTKCKYVCNDISSCFLCGILNLFCLDRQLTIWVCVIKIIYKCNLWVCFAGNTLKHRENETWKIALRACTESPHRVHLPLSFCKIVTMLNYR